MYKERGSFLIVALVLGFVALITAGSAVIVFTNIFDNIFNQQEVNGKRFPSLESMKESFAEYQKKRDAILEKFSLLEGETEDQELRAPNAPFPQNPDEPLSNPLDVTVPEPVLDPRHEDSIELINPPDFGFKEIIVNPTPEPVTVTCPKEGSRSWVKKYVGDYIYCIVPERPCIYSSCTFSRYYLDGTIDISVGKCQDESYINPKSSAPLCSELGI